MARPTPKKSALSGSVIAPPPQENLEKPADPPAPEEAAQPQHQQSPGEAVKERPTRSTKKTSAPAKPRPQTNTASTQRIGIYFRPGQFEAAKSAYLVDWQAGGEADTFALWIAAAVERHASLTPALRATATKKLHAGESGERGLTRSFNLPDTTVAAIKEAMAADREAGHWGSQSEFCGVAIAAATEAARERAGGTLPPAPARLPNRLIR